MLDVSQYVRAEHKHVELLEALKLPVSALLGVSDAAATALSDLGIETVFDFGSAWLFTNARAAAQAASFGTTSQRLGTIPSDWLKPSQLAEATALEDIGDLDIVHLRGMTDDQANAIKTALGISKIREFAYFPPQQVARQLVGDSVGGTTDVDEIQTELLRPRFGEYPTERVYYNTLVMLDLNEVIEGQTELNNPLSLIAPAQQQGFTRIAVGAWMTLSQSWYALGVTLGHMLHSLALAPGEATRIAVIDWSRRTSTTSSESITESEQLDSTTAHSRALSEVQSAVANEFQRGGSTSRSQSSSTSGSAAMSVGTGFFTSLFANAEASGTLQTASTQASASSSSWSRGTRSVVASMTQNVNDRTQQHSTSVRNRRASAVREVAQSEHEQISTRIVANYNHMHALTIQYYEVVQLYRTVTALHNVERVLFIPMQLLNFTGDPGLNLIDQYRGALIGAALNRRVRSLLIDDTTSVAIKPEKPIYMPFVSIRPDIDLFNRVALLSGETPRIAGVAIPVAGAQNASPPPPPAPGVQYAVWNAGQIARISAMLDRPIIRPNSNAIYLPDDAEVLSVSFDGVSVNKVVLDHIGANAQEDREVTVINGRADLTFPLKLGDLEAINVSKSANETDSGNMYITLAYLGRRFTTPAIPIEMATGTALQKVVSMESDQKNRRAELQAHLQANRAHYSTAIFQALDSATLVQLLTPFKWNGIALIDQVEPKTLTVAGNFIIVRAPVEGEELSGVNNAQGEAMTWQQLLEERGMNSVNPDTRLIPIPTNGVFAEAVLGRSNSAEKLDITRFWNWQDSPIPLTPPEIDPIKSGSRATPEDLKPGQLSAPVLNIMNPTTLPDPSGLSGILTAIANGNMFRDMSGLAGTQGLVTAGMQGTLSAATEAGKLASENMKTNAQKAVEMAKVLADIVKTAASVATGVPAGGGSSASSGSISGEGAQINHGRDMDARGVPTAKESDGGSPTIPGSGGTPSDGGGSPTTPPSGRAGGGSNSGNSGGGSRPRTSHETNAYNRTIGNPGGAAEAMGSLARGAAAAANTPPADPNAGQTVGWARPNHMSRVKVWMKAFIPKDIPGLTTTVARGPHQGKTKIPGPTPYNDCFLTDQRGFSDNISAAARMHSEVEFVLDRDEPAILQAHRCYETTEIDCEDGDVECTGTGDTSRMQFFNMRIVTPTIISVQVRAAANNPCFFGSPDIDYEGTIILDVSTSQVTFEGKVDAFPAFEMYASRDGSAPKMIFQLMPPTGNTPANLPGSANRPVRQTITLPDRPQR
jgi:hypothetical protein